MSEQSPSPLGEAQRAAAIEVGLLFAELLFRHHVGLLFEPPVFNGPEEKQRGQN